MRTILFLFSALLAAGAAAAQEPAMDHHGMDMDMDADTPAVRVDLDVRAHVVTYTAGPFAVHPMPGGHHGEMKDHVLRIAWPMDGWVRGYAVDLVDSAGTPLDRAMMHHAGLANLQRRELLVPILQCFVAASKETAPVLAPPYIGVPVHRGDSMALFAGLHSPNGQEVERVYVRYRFPYRDASEGAPGAVVQPMHFLVGFVPGGPAAFDLPPGRSEHAAEYVMPVNAHLIVAGGHVHDYAVSMRLVECGSGKTLVELKAHRRADGTVTGLDRFVFGFHEDALFLEKGRCYRVIATYDNPTGRTIVDGGMGSIGGPVIVDDPQDWPKLERGAPAIVLDVATL